MPKKTKKMATSNPLSKENYLSFSSVHDRINFLNEKHKKLLSQIKRKKTELSNLTQKIQTLSQEMFDKSRPLEEKLNSLDYEIHALFDKILSNKRLGERQKQKVIDIYQTLQLAGKISLRPDYFSKSLSIFDNCLETSSLKFFSIILIDPSIPISLPFESKLSDRPSVNA